MLRNLFVVAVMTVLAGASPTTAQTGAPDLRRLTLEELVELEVTTVSRLPEAQARTPAAVFVITQDDIRRSGVTSLPEALRLAPGVHVARIDANKWAVGIRGFTDRLSRAMLVLMDGRAVYSPLVAGTYWEVQDTLLEDVERIEVIRGPGGTLWGSNAVNGIISIITRHAGQTHGWLLKAGGGAGGERGYGAVRYGGARGTVDYRAYAQVHDRSEAWRADGSDFDAWRTVRAGARADWAATSGRLTVQGDAYGGAIGQRSVLTTLSPPGSRLVADDTEVSGGNVVARWSGRVGPLADARVQVFYDRTNRREPTFEERRDTADVDFQHGMALSSRHHLLWGAGYRITRGDTASVPTLQYVPNDETDGLVTGFVQDTFTVRADRLQLIAGAKLERNDYSGVEVQPSARLLWTPSATQAVVASVTRAVRIPSRSEADLQISTLLVPAVPVFLRLLPNDDFEAETLTAYEAGYRVSVRGRTFLTVSAFVNALHDVLSTETGPTQVESDAGGTRVVLPLVFGNGLHGNSHGLEATADVRLADWWRVTGTYSLLRIQLTKDEDSGDVSQERRGEGSTPRHQGLLQHSIDLPGGLQADWMLRGTTRLPQGNIPAYLTSDVRLAWPATRHLELAVVGRNLHHAHRLEFAGGAVGDSEVRRSVHAQAVWRW